MAEIDFRTTPVAELARSVRAKEVSAQELTEAALARIERLNPTYNAFVAVDGETGARRGRRHRRRDRRRAATPGRWPGSRSG